MKRIIGIGIVLLTVFSTIVNAQFKLDAEFKPRFEYRHGYKTLFPDDVDPAIFVSQRTRLNANYKSEKLEFQLSIQDIRVWGDVPQLNNSDNNALMLYQAWAKINFSDNLALKAGRQEIIYDDSRFFGNVDWAQQGRSHDLAMIKYQTQGFKIDLAFAYNQDGEAITGNTLNVPKTYKAFQYVYLQKKWVGFSASFLFLNNGIQYIDIANSDNNETRYSQTLGSHLKFNKNKLSIAGNLYYQFGNDVNKNKLSSSLLSVTVNYSASDRWTPGFGIELISGNDYGAPSNGENKAFTPFYGTNHKFNGYMDYFYVGNHINNVGLTDIFVSSNFKLGNKSSLNAAFHNFSAANSITGTDEKQLGSELDLVYSYIIQKDVSIKFGYSQLFASEGMEILKNNFDDNSNNWGWIMLVVKPTLFTSEN
jgi:alginate export protein